MSFNWSKIYIDLPSWRQLSHLYVHSFLWFLCGRPRAIVSCLYHRKADEWANHQTRKSIKEIIMNWDTIFSNYDWPVDNLHYAKLWLTPKKYHWNPLVNQHRQPAASPSGSGPSLSYLFPQPGGWQLMRRTCWLAANVTGENPVSSLHDIHPLCSVLRSYAIRFTLKSGKGHII